MRDQPSGGTAKGLQVSTGIQTDRSVGMFCSSATSVLLQTARANISSVEQADRVYNVRLVLDSGSQTTYITDVLREALGLKGVRSRQLKVSRFMDNDDSGLVVRNCDVVELRVHGCDGDDVLITANSVPNICPPPEAQCIEICKAEFSHLSGLKLSDEAGSKTFRNDCMDILIGVDYYWSFVYNDFRRGPAGPVAWSSKLGWILSGPVFSKSVEQDRSESTMLAKVEFEDDFRLDQ